MERTPPWNCAAQLPEAGQIQEILRRRQKKQVQERDLESERMSRRRRATATGRQMRGRQADTATRR